LPPYFIAGGHVVTLPPAPTAPPVPALALALATLFPPAPELLEELPVPVEAEPDEHARNAAVIPLTITWVGRSGTQRMDRVGMWLLMSDRS
jgi:hypothetical protein